MFKLNLLTPDKKIVADQEIDEITVPAYKGELNILPGHAPLMTTLAPGILKYKLKGSSEALTFAIGWGYCQVSPLGVNVLADTAYSKEEINVAEDVELLKTLEVRLANDSLTEAEWATTQKDIAKIKAELQLAQ